MDGTKWHKVTLTWDCRLGLRTSIDENGDFDKEVSVDFTEHRRHDLHEMSAFSGYSDQGSQRFGVMKFRIKDSHNGNTAIDAIVERLKSVFEKITNGHHATRRYGVRIEPPKDQSWIDGKFTLNFILADHEEFCDQAIVIARAVFEALGIEDHNGYKLADFSYMVESFVMLDGSWITYLRWLRMSHRLPVFTVRDMKS